MTKIAVIGLGFGDEGKGMVTSSLVNTTRNPLVVRYSGGHQAGHTVHYDGKKHVFSNFGSGTLQGEPTYWANSCTVDPVGLTNELKVLVDLMGDNMDMIDLSIDRRCPVTTPYDIQNNRAMEEIEAHGSCGVGFGATIGREENNVHLQFGDLFNPTVMDIKLNMIAKYYCVPRKELGVFREAVRTLTSDMYFPSDVIFPINGIPQDFPNYIFEGSQGLLLDQDIGFFPHVTRANVGLKGLAGRFQPVDEVYYVTRAYQTRHGNGPMTNEYNPHLKNTEDETNKTHPYQGEFRTGVLDLDLLKYAIESDRSYPWLWTGRKEHLVITCLDQMTRFRLIKASKIHTYDNPKEFVKTITDTLGIKGNTYTSWSPESEIKIVIKS